MFACERGRAAYQREAARLLRERSLSYASVYDVERMRRRRRAHEGSSGRRVALPRVSRQRRDGVALPLLSTLWRLASVPRLSDSSSSSLLSSLFSSKRIESQRENAKHSTPRLIMTSVAWHEKLIWRTREAHTPARRLLSCCTRPPVPSD